MEGRFMEALAPSDSARAYESAEEWRECEVLCAEGAAHVIQMRFFTFFGGRCGFDGAFRLGIVTNLG